MKKLSILALAAVGLLVGACSSDRDVAEASNGNLTQEDGDQFISLSINLPTTPQAATRNNTETNDNNYDGFELNDGLPSEYTVNDAMLVIFRPASNSTDQDDATFVAAYNVGTEPWATSSDHQVTKTSAKIVKKVGSTVHVGDLVLVVLNRNNLISFSDDPATFTVGTTNMLDGEKTYKDFRESLLTTTSLGAAVMTANGFYMTNAPLTDKQGSITGTTEVSNPLSGATLRTLVPITSVYETEAAARASTDPAEIYVERGMAKVTLQALDENMKLTSNTSYGISFVYWTLDHTNKKSYAVRSTEGHSNFLPLASQLNGKYRYAGMTDITEGNPGNYKYRTYFAKDPNYANDVNTTSGSEELSYATESDYTSGTGDNNPKYCFENTFDVDHQTVMNTTLVRLKVQVKDNAGAANLYIVNGNRGTIYKSAGVVTLAANAAINYIAAQDALGNITVNTSTPVDASDFTITVSTGAGNATVTIAQTASLAGKLSTGEVTDAQLQEAVNAVLTSVVCYANGMSYYTIRIKHFGDQLTPWHWGNTTLENPYPEVGNIYPSGTNRDNNYLGRYGVLRNNWYDIVVGSIQYLGEPEPKNYKNDHTTDDELDGYIAAQIHILSWAKRTQSWNL